MNKYLLLVFLVFFSIILFATTPSFSLKASGGVYDFIVEENILYAATDAGVVDIFNINKRKRVGEIVIPKIKDFAGDLIYPKIFSIDKLKNNQAIILTVQGDAGYRDIYIYSEKKLTKIFSQKDKLMVKRASFITKDLIMLGLLSNEIILYNFKTKEQIYRKQLSTSVFSDFTNDITRKLTITCEESGKIRLLNSFNGETIKVFSGQNLDNIYKVGYTKLTFIGAGQDRRVSVYKWGKEEYYIKASFLVYCVGIDETGKYGAYAANEDNDIKVFNIETRENLYTLKGQKSTLTKIHFLNNNEIISSGEDEYILFWQLN